MINVFSVIALTIAVTIFGMIMGYKLAQEVHEADTERFWHDMYAADLLDETPIAHKLDRKYGFNK